MTLKINSNYIISIILGYFPLLNILKIVKYSKKYQMKMNVSILHYQIFFLYYMLKKEKIKKFIIGKGDIINDEEKNKNDNKDRLLYNTIMKKLNEENSLILTDNNFDKNYKCLKSGESIKIIIDLLWDFNTIEERMKLLSQKKIIIKEIEYYHYDKQEDENEEDNIGDASDSDVESETSEKQSKGEDEYNDQLEPNKILDKDFIDKLLMANNIYSNTYITGQYRESFILNNNAITDSFIIYNKINIFKPKNIQYLDSDYAKNRIIFVEMNNIDCNIFIDVSYKYINKISLENLIEINLELNEDLNEKLIYKGFYKEVESKDSTFISTAPLKLPNLKALKCVNFIPNFYDLKNIEKIECVINQYFKVIKCDYFEKEFPFIVAFFRNEFEHYEHYSSTPLNFLLSDFEKNNIHTNLKYVHLSTSNRIYKKNFEKNTLKINEYNLNNLYEDKLKIPHYKSDNFSSIKIVDFNEKYYEEEYKNDIDNGLENHLISLNYCGYDDGFNKEDIPPPFKKQNYFLLFIEEEPKNCKIKEIYFPFLLYKKVLQNNTIKIHSYETLEKIFLYIYDFDFIYSDELFRDNNIKLLKLRKVYLCFGEIDIDSFKISIKNFFKKLTNNISSIIIAIINTYEYCEQIKKYIFSLPFISNNNEIKNKIFIVKMNPKEYEEGKYEFLDDNEEIYSDDNEKIYDLDNDLYFSDYKIVERNRIQKNKKKKNRHYKIRNIFK